MEWIKDYWYVVVLGLVAAMFLFGHKTKKSQGSAQDHHETHTEGDKKKGGHSCCH